MSRFSAYCYCLEGLIKTAELWLLTLIALVVTSVFCIIFVACNADTGSLFGPGCPSTISLDPNQITIAEGRTASISVRGNVGDCHVRWDCSDYTVVSLTGHNSGATIRGRKTGLATITAVPGWNEPDASSATCGVIVLPVSVHSIELSPDTLEVVVDWPGISRLLVYVYDREGVAIERWPFTWTSSDSTIAKVYWATGPNSIPQAGHVRGYKLGEVTITASYGDISGSAHVRVVPEDLYGVWGVSLQTH